MTSQLLYCIYQYLNICPEDDCSTTAETSAGPCCLNIRWNQRTVLKFDDANGEPLTETISYSLVAEWVSESWNVVPEDIISRSFLECGLFPLRGHGLEELQQ